MGSTPLVGAYKRYKAGSQKLIQFLFDSASARDEAATPQQAKRKHTLPLTKRIRTDDLIPLAQKIVAAKDPTIDIPLSILDCAKDTITGRRQAALWYAYKGDSLSNLTHQYFLSTLEKVFELLQREAKSRRPKRKKKIELATDTDDLGNVFLHLELEEPVTDERSSQNSAQVPLTSKIQQRVELDMSEEDIENDCRFAVYCLMEDLHKVRVHTRGVWEQYQRGELSLLTTCEITDRAMYIISMLRKEFVDDYPKLETWYHILEHIGTERYISNARGELPWVCFSKDHEHESPSASCYSDRLCMVACSALQDYQDLAHWMKTQPAEDATDRPVSGSLSGSQGHPFAKCLLDITADLVELASGDYAIYDNFDRYTSQLLVIARDPHQTYGPHTLVSTQIYMDIFDILGGDTKRGMAEASAIIRRLFDSSNSFVEFAQQCDNGALSEEIRIDILLRRRCKVSQSRGGRQGWTHQYHWEDTPIFIPSNILAALPLFCGTRAFREQVMMMDHGMALCDQDHFMLAAAHLYRAATAQGSLDGKWHDLDFIITRQNTRGPYIRGDEREQSITLIARQFCLALGLPLSQVAGKHHPRMPSDAICWSKATKMKTTSSWLQSYRNGSKIDTPYRIFYDCARDFMTNHKVADDRLASQWEQTKRLTPCQMLFIFQESLVEDEVNLNLDLHQFARRMIEVTISIRDIFLSRYGFPKYLGNRGSRSFLIANEILWEAATAENRGGKKSSTVLYAAGQLLGEFVKSCGSESIDQALPLSSGHIPDERKPLLRYKQQPSLKPSNNSLASG